MEADEHYRRKERIALVAIVVLASLAVASLLVAFSYYCYIRNKVSRRLKSQKRGQTHGVDMSSEVLISVDAALGTLISGCYTVKPTHDIQLAICCAP